MTTLSPLTVEERQLLQAHARGVGWEMTRSILFGGLFLTSIFFLVLFTAWKFIGPGMGFPDARHHAGPVLAAALTLAVGVLLPAIRSARTFAHKYKPQLKRVREDLVAGQAKFETLTVTAADELPDDYDDGAGFFLQLRDNRVLFVQGQDLYVYAYDADDEEDPHQAKTFPATTVRYRTAPRSGLRLGLETAGDYISPVLLASRRRGRNDVVPEDGTYYEGTLAETRQKFGLVPAKPAS